MIMAGLKPTAVSSNDTTDVKFMTSWKQWKLRGKRNIEERPKQCYTIGETYVPIPTAVISLYHFPCPGGIFTASVYGVLKFLPLSLPFKVQLKMPWIARVGEKYEG